MSEKFGYGLITKHVALNPEITADAKAVYMVLCSLADESGFCYPLVKTIRAYTGLSEYRFHKAMQNLREQGIAQTSQQKEGTAFARNTYQLLDRPYLKKSGAENDKGLKNLCADGKKSSNPRTRNIPEVKPPHPNDLCINQYQSNTNTKRLNNPKENIYAFGRKADPKKETSRNEKG